MTTYRAAYIPDDGSSTGGGIVLTGPEHAHLSDEELMEAAAPALAENNAELEAIGGVPNDESDIEIGDWTD